MRNLSKKERQARKLLLKVGITLIVVIIIIIAVTTLSGANRGNRQYTAEELLHDHDGDGIPDH